MVLLRHTLLTSCSRWQPWSHAERFDPWPNWTSRGRDGPAQATVHSVSRVEQFVVVVVDAECTFVACI